MFGIDEEIEVNKIGEGVKECWFVVSLSGSFPPYILSCMVACRCFCASGPARSALLRFGWVALSSQHIDFASATGHDRQQSLG